MIPLLFLSEAEAAAFAAYAQGKDFDAASLKDKELVKVAKKVVNNTLDALDIALFGRMVAKAADMNVEAAASFAHAISTHKVSNEIEFFTAVDDCKTEDESGSAHMGSLEFNSATYYRYVSLDLGQLAQTLGEDADMKPPSPLLLRHSMSPSPQPDRQRSPGPARGNMPACYCVKVRVCRLHSSSQLRVRVKASYLPVKRRSKTGCIQKKKLSGSLFGKQGDYEVG